MIRSDSGAVTSGIASRPLRADARRNRDKLVTAARAALAADDDDAPESANADTLQYTVRIQAPQPLAQLLEKNLDLMRFRGNARMDRRQLQRLIRAAPQQIETLVATEGDRKSTRLNSSHS